MQWATGSATDSGGTEDERGAHRDGRWYAVSYEGLDPLTGRDRRRWHRTSDEAAARALADTLPSSRPPSARGVTVSRYLCTRWLPARQDRLRPTTAFRYEQMIDRYVLPHIGRVPLRSLTIRHLEDLYAHLRRTGGHDGGPLAPKTVLNVHQILRTALGDAERAGLVQRNVARLMDPPCHGVAPEQRCWNEHQLRTFLQVAMTHRLGPAIWLAAMTGMRRGEVLGLRWTDIDLDAATLSIRRSVSCTGYQVHTTPTKTRTSRRAVDLDQQTVAVLRDWQCHSSPSSVPTQRTPHCSPARAADPFTRTRCRRPLVACNVPQVCRRSGCTIIPTSG